MRKPITLAALAGGLLLAGSAAAHENHACPSGLPDDPILPGHIDHFDISNGALDFESINKAGALLFVGQFNRCDGQGRPATTGTGAKRIADEPAKLRTSAPDADSCAGCHNAPFPGGAGDFVANVFVLAQAQDPVTFSVDASTSNDRNTLGMNGSGPIEMLAREMSFDLQEQADALGDGSHTLSSKGVDFDITKSNGIVTSARGIDTDLVIKPFHQAGVVVSLREFSTNAMNHHHGMQAEERFDLNPDKNFDSDFDEDGIHRELTVGDITAVTLWQAQLSVPGRVLPADPRARREINQGEALFADVGCASCHVPKMTLDSREFVEPNPFNPAGTCSDPALCPSFSYDMTREGQKPTLERGPRGGAVIRAYTDLKRHNLCDDPGPDAIRYFCNEQLAQGRPDQDGKPGSEYFLTRKLWDVGSSAPYGHRGDISTIAEAILLHGGEARESRDAFAGLSEAQQRSIVRFLKTLQVLPENSPRERIVAN